ncbi:hypothetical protein FM115_07275 [Marinilactibacillus psychrotolerans 42ea]|uniref:Uncharacterized protein n=1 Tax=Marinilactibacillus psychrotolerans 42ea TaxID=1255609 RepID=A0A1R4JXN8_9LACT|nr:hypothetical protein FM115_07275 [Marinilactibacillus psychrotolerans 42ea]
MKDSRGSFIIKLKKLSMRGTSSVISQSRGWSDLYIKN